MGNANSGVKNFQGKTYKIHQKYFYNIIEKYFQEVSIMPKKLTQEEFIQKVQDCVGDKYSVISEYQGKRNPVTLLCNIHNKNFTVTAECFMRGSKDIRSCCPLCSEEKKNKKFEQQRTEVTCAYCGKSFIKPNSKLKSKSGLYFCCREHKDLAQRINSGEQFNNMRPEHYNKEGTSNYRRIAFDNYPHECAVCKWNEDEDILQVHHIDENRKNGKKDNLIILCPTCHWKLTTYKYKLIDREHIVRC